MLIATDGVCLLASQSVTGGPVDIFAAERIEILAATLLYGSNAFGGVVNDHGHDEGAHQAFEDRFVISGTNNSQGSVAAVSNTVRPMDALGRCGANASDYSRWRFGR